MDPDEFGQSSEQIEEDTIGPGGRRRTKRSVSPPPALANPAALLRRAFGLPGAVLGSGMLNESANHAGRATREMFRASRSLLSAVGDGIGAAGANPSRPTTGIRRASPGTAQSAPATLHSSAGKAGRAGKKVVILGGGVAGMSAAHELVERGFEVDVYERWGIPGGKARSIAVPNSATGDRRPLPGEHGFRFFPRFYRHLPDTMKRIPYKNNPRGVYDNLVPALLGEFAFSGRAPIYQITRFPRSIDDVHILFEDLLTRFPELGFEPGELRYFGERIWQLLTSSHVRRVEEYERVGWWDFVGAAERSDPYKKYLADGLTRTLVAADAKLSSVFVGGDIALQLMLGMAEPGVSTDRLLNGPTNDVWIDPWLKYLRSRGVTYRLNTKVESLNFANGVIQSARVINADGTTTDVTGDYFILAVPVEAAARILKGKDSAAVLKADPQLASILKLASDVQWMNGIQFFLREDVPMVHGHVLYYDSPWALTSVSQHQFWRNVHLSEYGDGQVRGILSVDVSDWNTKGILYGKAAKNCTREEIKNEVWEQIKKSINVGGQQLLKDDDVHSWFMDPDMEEHPWSADPGRKQDFNRARPLDYEDAEPLLVAQTDRWHLRPYPHSSIPNLFLAADYVRTHTMLATMEAANEAARRAVNCILDSSGSNAPYCKIWDLHEPDIFALWRKYDEYRFHEGLPWDPRPPFVVQLVEHALLSGYEAGAPMPALPDPWRLLAAAEGILQSFNED